MLFEGTIFGTIFYKHYIAAYELFFLVNDLGDWKLITDQ